MRFDEPTLTRIFAGEITLAFRKWIRPTVSPGGTWKTALGELRVGTITRVEEAEIPDHDLRAAGYAARDDLRKELAAGRPGWLYRIEMRPARATE